MEVKKGYRKSDIGIIPEDWKVDLIKNRASITTGGRNTQDKIEDGQFPFFVRSQIVERINTYSYDGEAVLTAGDGVGTGKVFHYINGKFDIHQRVYKISDFDCELNGYYFFLYFSKHFYNRIVQMTAKSSVDSVRMEMIANMLIPIPPLSEQTSIARALSNADAHITSLEKLIAKKRLIKQGAMQKLLKPKKGWEVKKLGEIAEVVTGNTPPTNDRTNYGDEYLFVSPADLGKNKFIINTEKKLSRKGFNISRIFPENSILFTCIGSTIGKIGIAEFELTSNQQINAIFPNDNYNSDYLYYTLIVLADYIKSIAGEQAVPLINKSQFCETLIPSPNLNEQKRIASILSNIDAEISAIEQKLSKTHQIRQGMMQQLLTGKIRLV